MKRLYAMLAILLSMTVSFMLVSCGGAKTAEEDTTTTPAATSGSVSNTMHTPSGPMTSTTAPKGPNMIQKHPIAASIAAGIAAHHVAKGMGKNQEAAGKNKNIFTKHPVLSGVAAAIATHHAIKSSMHH